MNGLTFILLGKLLHIKRQNIENMPACGSMLAVNFLQSAKTGSLRPYPFTGFRLPMVLIGYF